ncbi:hypothetical protein D9613_010392 [Agrocybe pediades]|uniref:Uncharacterized protein n=1 Tax=Agrocybe pediades TaxID=84607 RepID=A0A8H4QFD4_9AGAR|nr:hypothetical protein D9613_010392 [Agrocybe pediades]
MEVAERSQMIVLADEGKAQFPSMHHARESCPRSSHDASDILLNHSTHCSKPVVLRTSLQAALEFWAKHDFPKDAQSRLKATMRHHAISTGGV